MQDRWFYAVGDTPIGPLAFDDLVVVLRQSQDPATVKLWRAGFGDWRCAQDVPQVAAHIFQPPPWMRRPEAEHPNTLSQPVAEPDPKHVIRGRVALLIGALVVLGIAALWVGASNFGKLRDGIYAREAKLALQDVRDPAQIQKALDQKPSNALLEMTEKIMQLAEESNRLTLKISDEIEPPGLANDINLATESRVELETYQRDLQMAATNAASFMPRYTALLNDERTKAESVARDLQLNQDTIRDLLQGIDNRHARFTVFNARMSSARAEFYRLYASHITLLLYQFGAYKVENGRLIFQNQAIADHYNASANALSTAAKRIADLETEGEQLMKFQKEGWEQFVAGQ